MKKINALFFTQSSGLRVYYDVFQEMRKTVSFGNVGFYVTDARHFKQFTVAEPQFLREDIRILREWDIVREAKKKTYDLATLEEYEKQLGNPLLWNVLVGDKRMYLGKKYAYDQDYIPRYSHDEMLSILQVGLGRIEDLFHSTSPDFFICFQCLTLGDYIGYLFARKQQVQVLNMRPTRIQNYFYAGEDIFEPSRHLEKVYTAIRQKEMDNPFNDNARAYMKRVQTQHALYEGVAVPSNAPPKQPKKEKKDIGSHIKTVVNAVMLEGQYLFGEFKDDSHASGYIEGLLAKRIKNPFRAKVFHYYFRNDFVKVESLSSMQYAFFPLHPEPEITLSVYSNAYLNQIEVIRLISHNLPVGMKLLVKEHPCAVGKRPLSYYRKILNIPNVYLLESGVSTHEIVTHAKLVTVIAGSVGFEGLLMKKPVITLGGTPYNFLPNTMVRQVEKPLRLGNEIRDLLEQYEYDENALLAFISVVMKESVPIDYYSRLVNRYEAYNLEQLGDREEQETKRKEHVYKLAQYLIQKSGLEVLASATE